jgi:hypothetical protein
MEAEQEKIERVIGRFKELFTERCNKISLLNLGEDSIRYDFFIALTEVEKLKSWEIQIEYPIDDKSFIRRNNEKSKRKEKPVMDLVIDKEDFRICAEFGLFRQNSNEKGNINVTEKTVKMLKDMIRLGIDSSYTERKAYFICVADDKMLRHRLRSKILGRFPSDYLISMDTIKKLMEEKTPRTEMEKEGFYERFIKRFEEMKCSFQAKLLFNEKIIAEKIDRETKIIMWEITRREIE